jgi:XTP/dITP diphosphohydrolase
VRGLPLAAVFRYNPYYWEGLVTVWFATGNIHKRNELAAILAPYIAGLEIKIPGEAGIAFEPDENGGSFSENAFIKARELYRLAAARGAAAPVIADDSGLCVDALGGRPGIYSARYGCGGTPGGARLNDRERNALLLTELGGRAERKARFVCAMVLLYGGDRLFLAQETCEGEIVKNADAARGSGGFGYDPLLLIPGLGRTVAELTEDEKNSISHRAKAGKVIAGILRDYDRTEHRIRT